MEDLRSKYLKIADMFWNRKSNYQDEILEVIKDIINIQQQVNVKLHGSTGGGFVHFGDTRWHRFTDIDEGFKALGREVESLPFEKRFTKEIFKEVKNYRKRFSDYLKTI